MAISRTRRQDRYSRVEQLVECLELEGRGRNKTTEVGRVLAALGQHIVHARPGMTAIAASLDRYIVNGASSGKRLAARSACSMQPSLSPQ